MLLLSFLTRSQVQGVCLRGLEVFNEALLGQLPDEVRDHEEEALHQEEGDDPDVVFVARLVPFFILLTRDGDDLFYVGTFDVGR